MPQVSNQNNQKSIEAENLASKWLQTGDSWLKKARIE